MVKCIRLFIAIMAVVTLISCRARETFKESYFVCNATDKKMSLALNQAIVWDSAGTTNPHYVWYNSDTLTLQPHTTIRLHPIIREDRYETSGYVLEVTQIIGSSASLIAGTDTIRWESDHGAMFTNDNVWSIFNKADWQTTEDYSFVYSHTFEITDEKIERSKQ